MTDIDMTDIDMTDIDMTDIPADHMTGPGAEAVSPVATEERVARRPRHAIRNGTHNGAHNGMRPGSRDDTANEIDGPVRVPDVAPPNEHAAGPVHVSWRHALLAGLACFALWLLLDAPTLYRSAQAGPLGVRRSVAVAVLRPIAAGSDALGLSHVVGAADRVIGDTGHAGSGVLQVEGPPSHRHRPAPEALRARPARAGAPRPTTPVTAPDGLAPLAPPTTAAPLRILVVGDSLGIDFGQSLVNDLAGTGVVNAVLDGHIDTGLARPDYFDWQAELSGDLVRYQPQAVVVFLGANDPQNFIDGGSALAYGTESWDAVYAQRVGAFMASATAEGARVLWIGMPPMADPALSAKMQALNGIYQGQAAVHPGVTYLSSWPVFSDAGGGYQTFLPDASGNEVQVREPDGTHIAPGGAQRLSLSTMSEMGHVWGIDL
jgi:hypothetical protein